MILDAPVLAERGRDPFRRHLDMPFAADEVVRGRRLLRGGVDAPVTNDLTDVGDVGVLLQVFDAAAGDARNSDATALRPTVSVIDLGRVVVELTPRKVPDEMVCFPRVSLQREKVVVERVRDRPCDLWRNDSGISGDDP